MHGMLIIVLAFGCRNFQADAGVHRGLPEQGAGGQVQVYSVPPQWSVQLLQSNPQQRYVLHHARRI
jgi:hypothetical protein